MTLYRTIVADPPWPYKGHLGSSRQHRPNSHHRLTGTVNSVDRYGKMTMDELCALQIPTHEEAHLYLWTTNTFLVTGDAARVVRAWGFRPITVVTWGKVKPDGTPSMKMGRYFKSATEHFIFAVKGSQKLRGRSEPTLFLSPRLARHSSKPEWFYELVERQSYPLYLELFARPVSPLLPKRLGWHTWGNEMANDVELPMAVNE